MNVAKPLVWSKELPAVPGWYWLHRIRGDVGTICHGVLKTDGLSFQAGGNLFPVIRLAGYRFAGPIPEPMEPEPVHVYEIGGEA